MNKRALCDTILEVGLMAITVGMVEGMRMAAVALTLGLKLARGGNNHG